MAPDPEEQLKKDIESKRKQQTDDLLDLLGELDSGTIPQLKIDKNSKTAQSPLSDSSKIENVLAPWMNEGYGTPATPKPSPLVTRPSFLGKSVTNNTATAPVPSTVVQPIDPNIQLESGAPAPGVTTEGEEVPMTAEEAPNGEIWHDLRIFILQLQRAFQFRYSLWERTINTVLSILRKMQQNMDRNTELLLKLIGELHDKIKKGLMDYKNKRDEVEKYSDVDYNHVIKMFKKTLELLNFQVRTFRIQQSVSDMYSIYIT